MSHETKVSTHMGPLTSYALHPKGVRFETQSDDEAVVLFLRQHPIVLLPRFLLGILLIFVPFLLPVFFEMVKFLSPFPVGYVIVGTLFWELATFGFFLASFIDWFFNIYIVTDRRVIDIDFYHLLYKEFSEAKLSNIEDLTYVTGGIVAAFFNYGNVRIQTAGEVPNIEFEKIPHPDRVLQVISDHTKHKRSH